ncbi:hypothetical protein [Brucella intermedia]|uniref:hypothetical protein n=1 Tax=Brucella intermedia TaxID=94625 RepID=UPI00124CD106|nr:hypothetical protein [Brucella intermedia]KAB2708315.1 hypothetical protein F9K80_14560 [Brucella intermedia]
MMALEGVSKGALAKAVKDVLRGVLGHGFHPSAPELRILCNENQNAVAADAARERIRRETIEENRRLAAPRFERDEAFYERQRRRMSDFHAAMKPNDEQAKENSYDAAMARLQAAAEANGHELDLETMKPVSTGSFKQAARAA